MVARKLCPLVHVFIPADFDIQTHTWSIVYVVMTTLSTTLLILSVLHNWIGYYLRYATVTLEDVDVSDRGAAIVSIDLESDSAQVSTNARNVSDLHHYTSASAIPQTGSAIFNIPQGCALKMCFSLCP